VRRIALLIEYDGTDFHGWQRQPGARTVQGELEAALERFLGEAVELKAAGRTDAGVHARGQVAHFDTASARSVERIRRALDALVPPDIHVRDAREVPGTFHARFSALRRVYRYHLRTEPTALYRRFVHVLPGPVDLELMARAARSLVGEKDFAGFTTALGREGATRCRVFRAEVARRGPMVLVTLEADHFLHRMVRMVVGTLVQIGRRRFPVDRIERILESRDPTLAGPAFPPTGLFFLGPVYPPGFVPWSAGEGSLS
jgi:tRNA pseudouridine38-40 synthase